MAKLWANRCGQRHRHAIGPRATALRLSKARLSKAFLNRPKNRPLKGWAGDQNALLSQDLFAASAPGFTWSRRSSVVVSVVLLRPGPLTTPP